MNGVKAQGADTQEIPEAPDVATVKKLLKRDFLALYNLAHAIYSDENLLEIVATHMVGVWENARHREKLKEEAK